MIAVLPTPFPAIHCYSSVGFYMVILFPLYILFLLVSFSLLFSSLPFPSSPVLWDRFYLPCLPTGGGPFGCVWPVPLICCLTTTAQTTFPHHPSATDLIDLSETGFYACLCVFPTTYLPVFCPSSWTYIQFGTERLLLLLLMSLVEVVEDGG